MKPKVLLVPAWYPSISRPTLGSFFKEQMELVQDVFDFKVILGKRFTITHKRAIKNTIRYKKPLLVSEHKEDYFQEISTSFFRLQWMDFLPSKYDNYQYRILYSQLSQYFKLLIKKGWKPDLIHFQSVSDFSVIIADIAKEHCIPFIVTEHNLYPFDTNDLWSLKRNTIYDNANKVLCVSHHVLRHLLIHNCVIKNYSVIGNLVNTATNNTLTEKKNIAPLILFVASHPYCKDIPIFFEAIHYLSKLLPTFVVNFVGIDPLSEQGKELVQLAKDMNVSSYIIFRGKKNRSEMLFEYNSNLMLVSSSYTETFGLAVAEAILNGLPVVCTDSGGVREFVNETNGIIVPIRQPESLAKAIYSIITTIHNYDKISMSQAIVNQYGVDSFKNRIKVHYHDVMNLNIK